MTTARKIPWLPIALLLSLGLMVVLAWQNRELRQAQVELQKRAFEPYAGMWMPDVATVALDGSAVRLGTAPARYQVLYFFTPSCPYCRQSAPAIRALAERLAPQSAHVQMVGVADGQAEPVRRYAAEQGFRFPIALAPDKRTLALFRANSVPLLVVVDAQGRVAYSHVGVLDVEKELEQVLAAVRASPRAVTGAGASGGPGR